MQTFTYTPFLNFLKLVVVLLSLVCIGCASTSDGGFGSAEPTPPIDPQTPVEQASTPQGQAVGNDISETVSDALDNAVDTVKSRDGATVRRGVFFSAGIRNLERLDDSVDIRTGDETSIANISVGYDQSINDAWVVGLALDFANRETSSNSSLDFSASSDTSSAYLFSSYDPNPSTSFSVYAGFGSSSLSSSRTTRSGSLNFVDETTNSNVELPILAGDVSGDSMSSLVSAGVSVRRNVYQKGRNQVYVGAEVDYSSVTTEAYAESGSTNTELAYREHTREDLQSVLSASANRVFNSSLGVIVPAITLSYVNRKPDENSIAADLVADLNQSTAIIPRSTDRVFGEIDLDVVLVRPGGWQYFANLNSTIQNELEESVGAKIGARLEF